MSAKLSAQRAKARQDARKRRIAKSETRRELLAFVAAGYSYPRIASAFKISVDAVRRHVQRAIDERPPESTQHFLALQRHRLNKALRCNDAQMESGDARAIPALLALLPHVERYWGLQQASHAPRDAAGGVQISAPTPLKSLESQMELPPLGARPAPVAS